MTQSAVAAPNPSTDPNIDPQVRAFLTELNKDSSPFWELPQPKPQEILTALQNKTPVDMSGVTTVEKTIDQDGRTVKLYVMTPEHVDRTGQACCSSFTAASGSSEISRTISGCCATSSSARGQIGVFVEYTPLPAAKYPTQMEESYAALKWVAAHAGEYRRRRQPHRRRGQLGRRRYDRGADAHGEGPERSEDQPIRCCSSPRPMQASIPTPITNTEPAAS